MHLCPKPIVLSGLIAVVPTSNDLSRKTLEIVGAFAVWRVLQGVVYSELLQREVREAVDMLKDPERYQGLHRVRI